MRFKLNALKKIMTLLSVGDCSPFWTFIKWLFPGLGSAKVKA